MHTWLRAIACIGLGACWSGAPAKPRIAPPPAPPPGPLAIEAGAPGRLVSERDGTPWQVFCVANELTKRPWRGGALVAAGRCAGDGPIAIRGNRVATVVADQLLVS